MNKKLTIKRVVIFVFFAYLLTTVWDVIFNNILSGNRYYCEDPSSANPFNNFAGLSMFGPAAAAFITRALTKEGMEHSMLKFNIKNNLKYYIMPFWVLLIYALLNALITPLMAGVSYSMPEKMPEITLSIVNVAATCPLLIGMYFGEEYGWRGYLYPKLEELMGTGKALIVSGIIWGVWHTSVLVNGHNFGRDIPFFPISNILLMCVMCIFIAPFFTYIAKKTDSVWPAAIAHAFFNNFAGNTGSLFMSAEAAKELPEHKAFINIAFFIGLAIMGTVFFIILVKESKESSSKSCETAPKEAA